MLGTRRRARPDAAARRDRGLTLPGATERDSRDDQGIRRNRRGRTLRGIADRDAAGSEGISGPRGRPRNLPERHGFHPYLAPPWRKSPVKVGPSRSSDHDRMPADRHLRLRLRSFHDCWRARHKRSAGRVLPATHDTRQAARRRCSSIWRGSPRRLRRGGSLDRGRTGGRHQGSLEAWRLHHRAR
jgi:hypothetical protein